MSNGAFGAFPLFLACLPFIIPIAFSISPELYFKRRANLSPLSLVFYHLFCYTAPK